MEEEDVVIVHDTSPEYAQKTLENMKQEISKHINQVRLTGGYVTLPIKIIPHTGTS